MTAVYKYHLTNHYGRQEVELPVGAEIVTVAMQRGHPTLWARVDPSADEEVRVFEVVATGARFEGEYCLHVGTCFDGGFVWHVLELVGLLSADH